MKRHLSRAKLRVKETNNLRMFNHFLTLIVILLGFYIIVAPFLPQVGWWVSKAPVVSAWTNHSDEVHEEATGTIGSNRLFIPSIGLEEVIHSGGVEQLSKGVVHRGHTSTPEKGGNTVMVGHRFTYDNKGVFYLLDKVQVGDSIVVHWDKFRYDYEVTNSFVVTADQISIEQNTDQSMLTLYTCTPLWSAKDRLVIQAKLVAQP